MMMLEEDKFANFCENASGHQINGCINYWETGHDKVRDIFLNRRQTMFREGKYTCTPNHEFNCLIKRDYDVKMYLMAAKIRHQNILTLIGYDLSKKSVLVEHMQDFGTFGNYMASNSTISNSNSTISKRREKFVDDSHECTPEFKKFLRLLLSTLKFMDVESLAHGDLNVNNIFVFEENDEIVDMKLFEIGVDFKNQSDQREIKKIRYYDFRSIGELIETKVFQDGLGPSVKKFIEYLQCGNMNDDNFEITIDDVLHHPLLTMMTEDDQIVYLERVIESKNVTAVNKSDIKWLEEDSETDLREEIDTKDTGNPYQYDAWGFIRLIRNSKKHSHKYDVRTKLAKRDPYNYFKHVLQKQPHLIFDLYKVVGHLSFN